MPVIPTDLLDTVQEIPEKPTQELIAQALIDRAELSGVDIDLQNREITRKAASQCTVAHTYARRILWRQRFGRRPESALLRTQHASGSHQLVGRCSERVEQHFARLPGRAELGCPVRNRVAKADQYRSELEYRQAELREQQLKKQIRIEVRNAEYALEQGRARVDAAKKARDLAQKTFNIMQKEQQLGAGSSFQTLTAQRDLALAQLDLVNASTAYQKSKLELQRATGTTLEENKIQIQNAVDGVAP